MKIPKKVKILGVTYKVKFVDNLLDDPDAKKCLSAEDRKKNALIGYCSPNTLTIFLSKNTAKQNLTSVFIHEILEAINSQLALNIRHADLDRLETALHQVLTENKLLE